MASNTEASHHEDKLRTIINSNHQIRNSIQTHVHHFLQLREDLLHKSEIQQLPAYKDLLLPLIEGSTIEGLNIRVASERVQLAFCGENSSGKSAFIQTFLGIGKILPSGDGPVTARITKLTYAPGNQARVCVRKTLRDETLAEDPVDLSAFFVDEKPKWMEIKCVLEKHLKRRNDLEKTSAEFADWARCFVEIHIPSPVLASGIDVYDTPGFLLDDAPVLKEILRDLVELVHPTIVFMYENPSTDDATKGCFLVLKTALRDLDSGSIFFLNSKVDVTQMKKFKKDMKIDDFLRVLAEERTGRYRLLLQAPFFVNDRLEGLPSSIDECHCFDVCSGNSQIIKPYGPQMNGNTVQNIIQFVANNDLGVAIRIGRVVLPIIDAFFRLLRTSARTPEEFVHLKDDVINWENEYFDTYETYTEHCLQELLNELIEGLESEEQAVIQPFLTTRLSIDSLEPVIQTAIRLQIIRPTIRNTFWKFVNSMLRYLETNFHQTSTVAFNDILKQALGRQEINDFAAQLLHLNDSKKPMTLCSLYMINTISTPILQCVRVLQDLDISHETARTRFFEEKLELFSNQNRQERIARVVRKQLLTMQTAIERQRGTMLQAMKLWGDNQKAIVRSLIDAQFQAIDPLIISHRDTVERLERYTSDLITVECGLRAAQDSAKFSGSQPEKQSSVGEYAMFSVFTVDWGMEKDLMVKKLRESNAVLNEAHYHLKVVSLRHPNILNVRYLYEHRLDDHTSELWMIFPPMISSLEQFLQQHSTSISTIMTIKWTYEIVDALTALHGDGLVHRNVVLGNIFLTEDQCVLLADLTPWDEQCDISVRYQLSATPQGKNDDMKGLGQIGLYLSNCIEENESASAIVKEFRALMLQCFEACQKTPVRAQFVHEKLKSLIEMLE